MKGIVSLLLAGSLSISMNLFGQDDFYNQKIEESFRVTSQRPLEVLVDIDVGEVSIMRGVDAHSGTISIRYTDREFQERIQFDEKKNRLLVSLEKKNWRMFSKRHRNRDLNAEVVITLPYGVEILLDAKLKAGEAMMEMGGLRLREFTLKNWAGEVEVRFDEPNPIEMDFLDIDVKIGEGKFVQLGNARFKEADINGGIGEINVDFTGENLADSRARVDLDIGQASITVPVDIGVKMRIGGGFSFLSSKNIDGSLYRRGDSYYSENYEDSSRRLYLRVTPGLGELNIDCQ